MVTGRNGSGKSTLLAILAGLLTPTKGQVTFTDDGKALDNDSRRDAIGLVAPEMALYAELTGRENLEFFGEIRGVNPGESELRDLLALVGLEGRGGDLVRAYSSGMRARLKYAAALLHHPAVLLLDEPTANLDTDGAEIVATLVSRQKATGLVVVATNEPDEVALGGRRIHLV